MEGGDGEGSGEMVQFRGEQDSRRWGGEQEEEKVRVENLLLNLQTAATHLLFVLFQASGKGNCGRNRTAPFPHHDPPPSCSTLHRWTGPVQIGTATLSSPFT